MMKRIIVSLFAVFTCSMLQVDAAERPGLLHPRTREAFNQVIDENDFVVVYVYKLDAADIDRVGAAGRTERWNDVDRVQRILSRYDQKERYDGIIFAYLNLNWGDNKILARTYRLSEGTDTLLFFRRGALRYKQEIDSSVFTERTFQKFLQKSRVDESAAQLQRKKEREEAAQRQDTDEDERPTRRVCRRGHCRVVYEDEPVYVRRRYVAGPYAGWSWGWPDPDVHAQPSIGFGLGFSF